MRLHEDVSTHGVLLLLRRVHAMIDTYARLACGLVMATSGVLKARRFGNFASYLTTLFPRTAPVVARLTIAGEIAIGLSMPWFAFGPAITAGFLTAASAAASLSMLRTSDASCACFGGEVASIRGRRATNPLREAILPSAYAARNVLFIGALCVAQSGRSDWFVAAALLAYAAWLTACARSILETKRRKGARPTQEHLLRIESTLRPLTVRHLYRDRDGYVCPYRRRRGAVATETIASTQTRAMASSPPGREGVSV